MKLLKKVICVIIVGAIWGLAGLACEPETTVSHEHTETHVGPAHPVLEGD
jgi:hypothetical protein